MARVRGAAGSGSHRGDHARRIAGRAPAAVRRSLRPGAGPGPGSVVDRHSVAGGRGMLDPVLGAAGRGGVHSGARLCTARPAHRPLITACRRVRLLDLCRLTPPPVPCTGHSIAERHPVGDDARRWFSENENRGAAIHPEAFRWRQACARAQALWPIVEEINALAEELAAVPDAELQGRTEEFCRRLAEGETLDDLLPEAYAVVKEACRRNWEGRKVTDQDFVWDMVPFDVQLFGGIVLHEGKIAEMATGEGRPWSPSCLSISTPSKARACISSPSTTIWRGATRVGRRDPALAGALGRLHPEPDELRSAAPAYTCDVTYGTNNEFGFDYLRDNMAVALEQRVQRGHNFAIIDEVDSVLIDEASDSAHHLGPDSS